MYSTLKQDALSNAVCFWKLTTAHSLITENHKHFHKTFKKNFYLKGKTRSRKYMKDH